MLNKALKIVVLSLCICSGAASADFRAPTPPSGSSASPTLLTAGMFRLESERSYKLSLQMALGILTGHTEIERSNSLQAVERYKKELTRAVQRSEKAGKAFNRVNVALSDQLDGISNLNVKNAAALYEVNEDVLIKMNFLSFALEADTSDTSSRISGLAMRQASLAQRMAKIVLLRSLDKSTAARQGLQVDLEQSRIEFLNGMSLLANETNSDRFLRERMRLAQQQWMFYDRALQAGAFKPDDLRNISSTSDRIAEMMVEMVRLTYGLVPDPRIIAERR
ncbi:hypothetical protein RF679_03995 [Undibacterium cyanobacteriorum]|uniref:Uncharacterized protein n=1 Tax=Undibacterium cyanobacteriorum TaxID=3073561 RepID=A0ABY9RKS6_9BURK|nr:hypothetical protein [Undibacterium sp. 20NA77.5]WMW81448.1 hypothetical protein RF679_03995 [Undibacterium sp. 20NA77.5]